MAMIQGIDGSALLQAFRAGRQDRYANEDRLRTRQKEDEQRERGERFGGLIGEYLGARGGGVAGQFTPSAQQEPQSFGEAFTPEGIASAGPPAPIPAAQPPARTRRAPEEILREMIAVSPEQAGQIISALKSMDEMTLNRTEARNNFMGAAARYVSQGRTPEERLQRFQIATPQLIEAGYSPEELDGIDNDLSDQRLQFYMATAIDYDKMIDNELAEREFNAGKTVPVTAGGNVALVMPDGSARYVIGGPEGAAPIQVQSIEEAQALPPGTRFIDPNGVERVVPGGPASAPGGFPG